MKLLEFPGVNDSVALAPDKITFVVKHPTLNLYTAVYCGPEHFVTIRAPYDDVVRALRREEGLEEG